MIAQEGLRVLQTCAIPFAIRDVERSLKVRSNYLKTSHILVIGHKR